MPGADGYNVNVLFLMPSFSSNDGAILKTAYGGNSNPSMSPIDYSLSKILMLSFEL